MIYIKLDHLKLNKNWSVMVGKIFYMKEWTLPANLKAETWLTLRQMPYLSNKKYSKFHINVMFSTRIKKVLAKN